MSEFGNSGAQALAFAEGRAANERTRSWTFYCIVLLFFAAAIHLACIVSPPSLMDDTDAVEAQIPRNMITSGDWVTARLDGVIYLEKSPLSYWLTALSYKVFGVHDWSARIPFALASIALTWLVAEFARWAFGIRAGFYAGLSMGTSVGLFLFTRILIPDVMLTFTISFAMWSFLRALDEEEPHPRVWASLFAANLGLGLLLKSLIGLVFPIAACFIYLIVARQLLLGRTWKRIRPLSGIAILLIVAAPWHILATIRNPPWFAFTLRSGPGNYHGFLWFYFINEQLLRFLNLRYPRDYATVPRLYFWLFHLAWLFPWSVYLPSLGRLSYRTPDRAGQTRLLALCWISFILIFFTLSTTQEYYSMPCWPAFALLLGSTIAIGGRSIQWGTRALTVITTVFVVTALGILYAVRHVATPGDISMALGHHPGVYKLSLGHMEDLNLDSFAYLRLPLAYAVLAFGIGAVGTLRAASTRTSLNIAIMMVLFFQAARSAMVTFDPFLSSRPLANAILAQPRGTIIVDYHYYTFSSIAFYTGQPELLLNGRTFNFEYGANAPGSPDVFIDDAGLREMWSKPQRLYLVAYQRQRPRLEALLGQQNIHVVATSGGKFVLANDKPGLP